VKRNVFNCLSKEATLVIISVPVDTALPSLLSLQSSCAKTSLTACYSIMIYINVIQTILYFVYIVAILHVYTVCLYCDCLLCV